MKTIFFVLLLFVASLSPGQDPNTSREVKKTDFNDAATALSNKAIADFFPMHDKQINEILRICNKGNDIVGSVNALISLGVYLGSDLDLEEEEVIIRGSKIDVVLYNDICKNIISSFSKPLNSSIEEAENIIKAIEEGKGREILKGIQVLGKVKYRMRRGSELIVNPEQLDLWANVGKVNEVQFEGVYKALLLVGLNPELNYVSATAIMDLIKNNKVEDISKIATVLNSTGWRCEGEFDIREAVIIENIIGNKYQDVPLEEIPENNSVTEIVEQK